MRDFEFQTVPHVMMSYGAARRMGELLRARYAGLARVCVVTDRFLNTSGLIRPALDSLAAQGWQVTLIDDVIADPPDHVVLEAAQRAREAARPRPAREVVLGRTSAVGLVAAEVFGQLGLQEGAHFGAEGELVVVVSQVHGRANRAVRGSDWQTCARNAHGKMRRRDTVPAPCPTTLPPPGSLRCSPPDSRSRPSPARR